MKDYEIKRIADRLTAYSLGMLQDFITFDKLCKKHKIKIEEVAEYVRTQFDRSGYFKLKTQSQQIFMDKMVQEKFPHCPICDSRLMLEEVNTDLARIIDDHSHSWWICPDIACEYDPETSDKHPYEILSDMGIMVHKRKPTPSSSRRKKAAMKQLNVNKRG